MKGENIGGLDYKIDVTGNFKSQLDAFQKQIDKIKGDAKGIGIQDTTSKTRGHSGTAEEKARAKIEEQIALLRKSSLVDLRASLALTKETVKILQKEGTEGGRRLAQLKDSTKEREKQLRLAKEHNRKLTQAQDNQNTKPLAALKADILSRAAKSQEEELARAREINKELTKKADLEAKAAAARTKDDAISRAKIAERQLRIAERQAVIAQKKANYDNISLQASNRAAASRRVLAIKEQQINDLVQQQGISYREAASRVGVTSAQAKQLGLNMWDAEHAARQFLFTFRRLVGILAVFTLARKLSAAIAQSAAEMITFNQELESAEISIATVLVSVGRVRDASGKLVTGQDAFNIALNTSREVMQGLKKDAVNSVATFEALVQAYQVAVGPGLAAGLDPNQIREVSKRLTEGAIAMGVPLNQLSEEIRSILAGTATQKNTRIAALFGGAKEANEAIRTAKEQGTLYETLMDKLKGVAIGAKAAEQSLAVLRSNLKDNMQLLLAEGGLQAFKEFKETISALSTAFVSSKENQIFAPEAIGVVREMSQILEVFFSSFRNFLTASDVAGVLTDSLRTLRGALQAVAPLAVTVFAAFLNTVAAVLNPIAELVAGLAAISTWLSSTQFGKIFLDVLKYTLATVAATRIWLGLVAKIALLQGVKGIGGALTAASKTIRVINQTLALQAALAGVSLGAFQKIGIALGIITKGLGPWGIAIAAILAIVGLLNAKFRFTDKIFGRTADNMEQGAKNSKEFLGSISGAANEAERGADATKSWADELKDMQRELRIQNAIKGLEGDARKVGEAVAKAFVSIEEQTKQYQEQLKTAEALKKASQDRLAALKKEEAFLKKSFDEAKASEPPRQRATGPLIMRGRELPSFDVVEKGTAFYAAQQKSQEQLTANKKAQMAEEAKLLNAEESRLEVQKNLLEILNVQLAVLREGKTTEDLWSEASLEVAKSNAEIAASSRVVLSSRTKELAVMVAKQVVLQKEVDIERDRRSAAILSLYGLIRQAEEIRNTTKDEQTRNNAIETRRELVERLAIEQKKSEAITEAETAKLKEGNREIERRKTLLAGGLTGVLQIGLEDVDFKPLGENIASVITDSIQGLSGVIGGVFKDAIDPRKDVDLRTAFGEFFLDIAGRFAEALTEQLVISPLVEGLTKSLASNAAEAGTGAATEGATSGLFASLSAGFTSFFAGLTATLSTIGTALVTGFTTVFTALGGILATLATTAFTFAVSIGQAMGNLLVAALTFLATAIKTASASLFGAAKGGLIGGYEKGGKIAKGYAHGGRIGGFERPSHIPSTDTVPAWLTPGEFVIRKSSVNKYGAGLLDAINRGVLNPSSFMAASTGLQRTAAAVQGFAAGGGVRSTSSSSSKQAAPVIQQVVLPVLPASESTMEQLVRGGRSSFSSSVNKVDIQGDPNKSGRW